MPLFLISTLSLYALLAWAHEGETDKLGCHEDTVTGNYHCHKGPLAGREFLSSEDAAETLENLNDKESKDNADEQLPAAPLRMLSWNFTSIGTQRFEYDRIVSVIAETDFLVMQEVEFTKDGESALTVISGLLSRRVGQRICKGWFKSSTGERGRHAFLWRDNVVSYVEKNGMIQESCPDAPVVIRIDSKKLGKNDPFMATFFLKARRQMFNVVSIQLEKRPKQKEITPIFIKLSKLPWPVVVAGNFKLSASDKAFKDSLKMDFKPVLKRKGNATSNLWTKNLSVVHAEAVDLPGRFPELSAKEIDKLVSSFPPLLAEISFSPQEADELKAELVKKSVREKALAQKVKARPEPEKPRQKPLPVHDDLEHEADD